MAETKQKIYLKRSSVSGKTPTADQLQYGEPAINYHAGSERIFIKNSSGDVISFLPDHVIIENEKVTAAALTDLNSRVEDLSAVASTKVDKVSGKGLSTNDYTTTEKNKLAGITAGAEPNVITAVTAVSASTSSKVVTVTKVLSASTADNAVNATNATTATKIGSSTVGSGVNPIYINAGTPTASTSSVGGATQPVYLKNGVLTACNSYSDNDTKNTAGSENDATNKLFIVGATAQTANSVTKSNAACYISGNKLYSNGKEVLTDHQTLPDFINSAETSTSAITAENANVATKVGHSIKLTNTSNTVSSFDGSADMDLTSGVYFAKTSNSADTVQMNATNTNTTYPVAVSTGTASGKRAPAFATAVTINPSTGAIAAKSISENGTALSSKYQAKGDYALASSLSDYQKKLTAGTGIAISGDNIISTTLDTNPFVILTGTSLPTTNIQSTKIYLLPASTTGTDNTYIEYAYVNSKWEKIGEFKPDVDLSSYATTSYVNGQLAKKQDSSAFIVTAVTLNTGSTAAPTISNNTLTLNVKNGTEGFRGSQGATGANGDKGAQGEKGDKGAQGEKGNKGNNGVQGDKGAQGLTGDKGYRGAQGEKGDKGAQGEKGNKGNNGVQGDKGATGNKGNQGLQGDKGAQGNKGAQGATGPIGADGNAISLTNAATSEKVYLTGTLQTGTTMSSATWRNASTLIFSGNTLFINNKAALTEHQSLAAYAKTADVPSIKVNSATKADTASKVANALSLTNSAGTEVTYDGSESVSLDSIRYAANAAAADTAYKLELSPNTDNYSYPVLVMPVSTSLTYAQYQPAEYVAKILINPSKGALSATTFVENGTSLASKYSSTSHTHSNYSLTSHTHSDYSLTGHTHSISDISGAITLPYALSLTNSAGTEVTYDGSESVSLDSIRYAANAAAADTAYKLELSPNTDNYSYPVLVMPVSTSLTYAQYQPAEYVAKILINPSKGALSATTFVENGTSLASKYSSTSHTHSNYSLTSHTHSDYSLTSHTHSLVDSATTSSQLGTATVGSTSQPIYLSGGTPYVCTDLPTGGGDLTIATGRDNIFAIGYSWTGAPSTGTVLSPDSINAIPIYYKSAESYINYDKAPHPAMRRPLWGNGVNAEYDILTTATVNSESTSNKICLLGATSYTTELMETYGAYGVYASGSAIYATNGFYETSDERKKDFEEDIDCDLDALTKIPKKYFKWKGEADGCRHIGTSAQEIMKLYPEIVSTDDEGYLHLAYDKLSIIALAAIDKIVKENKSLKSEVDSLRKENQDILKRLKALEAKLS